MTPFATFFADDHSRPAGFLSCPEELTPYLNMIDNGRFEEALAMLLDVKQFNGLMGVAWARYLKGIALFSLELFDAGLDEFNIVLAHMEAIDRSDEHRDGFRIAALCLKKIGWFEREEQNYNQAYHDHFRVFDLAERFGSYEELHDAAINLVIDCRFLNDTQASDEWLQKSIAAAEKIEDEHARNRALAISRVHLKATEP
jgi:tetratricopeptide (TPR) repeat protein